MALAVLYDDDCGVCAASARRLGRRRGITAVAIQSREGSALLRDLEPEARLSAFHVIAPSGDRRTGGAAIPALARELPGGRPLAALAERFPGATDRAYDAVARNRHRLSAAFGLRSCSPASPKVVPPEGATRLRRASRGRSG